MHLFGRVREPNEMSGIWRQLLLTRAANDEEHTKGQDGGFVSAMLNWLLEHDYIEAALVSGVEPDDAWKAKPVVVATREEDGYVMILRTPSSPRLDPEAPISCEWRPGDVW